MKRIRILSDEGLDTALGKKAREERRSNAAPIRRYLRERLKPLPPLATDALRRMVGADAFEPRKIHDVVHR